MRDKDRIDVDARLNAIRNGPREMLPHGIVDVAATLNSKCNQIEVLARNLAAERDKAIAERDAARLYDPAACPWCDADGERKEYLERLRKVEADADKYARLADIIRAAHAPATEAEQAEMEKLR